MAGAIDSAYLQKIAFFTPGTYFSSILVNFGSPLGAQNAPKSHPGGYRKKRQFLVPIFLVFLRFGCHFGGLNLPLKNSFSLLWRSQEANFSIQGSFLSTFAYFLCFLSIFVHFSRGCLIILAYFCPPFLPEIGYDPAEF